MTARTAARPALAAVPAALAAALVAAVLAGLVAVLGVLGAPAALAAGTSGPTATATTEPAASTAPRVQLRLDSLTPTAVSPGDQVSVAVRVVNPTSAPLSGLRVRLFVNSPVLTTRSALAAWAADEGVQGGDRFADVAGAEQRLAAPVPAGGSAPVTIRVASSQLHLSSAWGPRGVTVDVIDARVHRLAAIRTFLVWTPQGAPPSTSALTVLAPVTADAPDLATGAQDPARLAALTAPGGRLSRVLEATAGTSATLLVDPSAAGGTSADQPSATAASSAPAAPAASSAADDAADDTADGAWQQRLRAAAAGPGGAAVLPLDDADVTSLAAAHLGPLYRAAADAARQRGATVLGTSPDVVSWPASGTLDADTAAAVAGSGSAAVVLSSPGGGGPARTTAVGSGSRTPAVGVDASASAVLAAGTAQGSTTGAALTTARLLAETAVAARAGTALSLAAPRGWDPDPAAARSVLDALTGASWVRPQPLGALLTTSPTSAVTAASAPSDRGALLPAAGLAAASHALSSVQTTAAAALDPAAVVDPVRERVLAATALAWRAHPAAWRSGVAALTRTAATTAGALHVVQGSPVTVISSKVEVPVTLYNGLDQRARVVVAARSSSLRVRTQGTRTVTIAPRAQQQVQLPLRALASGDAKLTVVLRTTSGALVTTGGPVQVRVRAHWESVGVGAIAGIAALVLLAGVARTVVMVRGSGGRSSTGPAGSTGEVAGAPAGRPRGAGRRRRGGRPGGRGDRPGPSGSSRATRAGERTADLYDLRAPGDPGDRGEHAPSTRSARRDRTPEHHA